ncbi:MAG: riboflavin synthase [Chloroflexi bacterium]|nr:riboflavin synthase [Chloroflexota bacterium]
MFTGIVEEVGKVIEAKPGRLRIGAKTVLDGTRLGDSIAVNGVCLTVAGLARDSFSVDVVPETLRRSNLRELRPKSAVNLERSLQYGGRIGGHLVQGHVDARGRIASITPDGDAILVRFKTTRGLMRYVVEKGFIAVDGVSLTVVECGSDWFTTYRTV